LRRAPFSAAVGRGGSRSAPCRTLRRRGVCCSSVAHLALQRVATRPAPASTRRRQSVSRCPRKCDVHGTAWRQPPVAGVPSRGSVDVRSFLPVYDIEPSSEPTHERIGWVSKGHARGASTRLARQSRESSNRADVWRAYSNLSVVTSAARLGQGLTEPKSKLWIYAAAAFHIGCAIVLVPITSHPYDLAVLTS